LARILRRHKLSPLIKYLDKAQIFLKGVGKQAIIDAAARTLKTSTSKFEKN
jgi:hypothetical protein